MNGSVPFGYTLSQRTAMSIQWFEHQRYTIWR